MAWDERQHALLKGMGLRAWSPMAAPVPLSEPMSVPMSVPTPEPMSSPAYAPEPSSPRAASSPTQRPVPVAAPRVAREPSSEPAPALDNLDWASLRAAVADCRACGLCETRRQTVFGVGATQAHWMVIGEAPGEQEDRTGEPFVGDSGQLLDRMLASLGLSRDAEGGDPARQVYIANTLKCRPPQNRNPSADEMARCEPFLVRQIALLKPKIILAMGRFAVQALLRSNEPIGRLRGKVHHYQGVPLIVTYHPSYLLRSLPEKARAWEDLCLAAATAEAAGS